MTIGRPAVGGEVVDFLLEATSNPTINDQFPDPNSDLDTAGRALDPSPARAQLIVRNDDVHGLVHAHWSHATSCGSSIAISRGDTSCSRR